MTMKKITFLATAVLLAIGLMAQNATDGNWKNSNGTWEKDVTPTKFKFSTQTTEQLRPYIFPATGKGNPDAGYLTEEKLATFVNGDICFTGLNITNATTTISNGVSVENQKMVYNPATSGVTGWHNVHFFLPTIVETETAYKVKISTTVNLKNGGKWIIYNKDGVNDPENPIAANTDHEINYTQADGGRRPYRLGIQGVVGGATINDVNVKLFGTTEPAQVNITESVSGEGTVTKAQNEQLHTGDVQVFTITPKDGESISSATYGDVDIKNEIQNNIYTTAPITENKTLVVTFTSINTDVANAEVVAPSITIADGIVRVAGVDSFEVYSLTGQLVNAQQRLQKGIYIVKTTDFAQKIVVK